MLADSHVEINDRAKGIVISGGSISSLEVDVVLYKHPDIKEPAVVAHPDETLRETPHAFVALKPGADAVTADNITG